MRTKTLLGSFVPWVFFSCGIANAKAVTTIEAYGDSLTSGFLAHTSVDLAPPLSEVSRILSDLARYGISKNPKYLEHHHRPNLAWPVFLAERWQSNQIRVQNFSVTMAKSSSLPAQVTSNRTIDANGWGFFFIGHNDLNRNEEPLSILLDGFTRNITMALSEWDLRHRGSRAFLIPIGEIHKVYELLQDVVWYNKEVSYTCRDSWTTLFPYGRFFHRLLKEGRLVSFLEPRIRMMNMALEKAASAWNLKSQSNRFVYLSRLSSVSYEKSFFAVDCFHLSEKGQREWATQIYHGLLLTHS